MRRKTSKEILAESFRELADIKPIDKITIKDIVGNCGYSPATFYRQFKDKYDLIAACNKYTYNYSYYCSGLHPSTPPYIMLH